MHPFSGCPLGNANQSAAGKQEASGDPPLVLLCYYVTNYGKITSDRDQLFQDMWVGLILPLLEGHREIRQACPDS